MSQKNEKQAPGPGKDLSATPKKELAAPMKSMPMGLEDVDIKSIKLPQMVLMQGLSPLVMAGRAKIGDIVNNITDQVLAQKGAPVVFIPSFYFKRRIKWIPMDDGGGIDCRSKDAITGDVYGDCGTCPHANTWVRKQEDGKKVKNIAPACTLYHCLMGHIQGDMTPIILDLAKTKEKVANKLLSVMLFSGSAQPWKKAYKFWSLDETSKANGKTYENYDFQVLPGEPSKEDQEFGEALFSMYRAQSRNIAMDLQHEDFEKEASAPSAKDKEI